MKTLPSVIDPSYVTTMNAMPSEDSYVIKYRPLSGAKGSNKIEFSSTRSPDCVIDLSATQLSISFKVLLADGKNVPAVIPASEGVEAQYLGTVSDMLGSYFTSMSVSLNNTLLYQNSHQNYLSYVVNLVNYSQDYRKSVLYGSGWGEYGADNVGSSEGAAFKTSASRISESRECHLIGKLNSPLFMQHKMAPCNVELGLSLIQSAPELFLITNLKSALKLELQSAELHVRYIRLKSSLLSPLQEALNKSAYKISFARTEVRSYTIPIGFSSFTQHNVHYGPIPSKLIAFMVPTKNYKGSFLTSPFKFSHANLNSFCFMYNNTEIPLNKISFNMKEGRAEELFDHVNRQLGVSTSPTTTPSFTYENFTQDFFMLAQLLNIDVTSSASTFPGTMGTLGISLGFQDNLTESITLVLISQFANSVISIAPDGGVVVS